MLAVSLGDPAGIGPELIAEAWVRRSDAALPAFFVCGGAGVLAQAAIRRGFNVDVVPLSDSAEAVAAFAHGIPVLGPADCDYLPGLPSTAGAVLALASLTEATRLTVAGAASGLVTAPIAKAELAKVGFTHPGQTEFVAAAAGVAAERAVMMLAGPSLRTVPLTVHVPLREVPARITRDLIVERCSIAAHALREDFGIDRPRLALCGLNPHAGEQGRMGREEIDVIAPAIAELRALGIDASGPHPADALFTPAQRATYDLAVAMYHDQALVPLKTLDFDHGVNVTLGLPVVRTSPDHGTAFAIAGTGVASAGATIAAIRMAGEVARRRSERAPSS